MFRVYSTTRPGLADNGDNKISCPLSPPRLLGYGVAVDGTSSSVGSVAACTPQWPRVTELWRMEVVWRGWEQAAPIVEYWRLCGTTSCPCYFLSSIGVRAQKISARPPNDCYWTFALPFAVAPSALPTGLSWGEERESIWFLKDNYKRL